MVQKKEKLLRAQMIEDVVSILTAPSDKISLDTKKAALKHITWRWTEFNGKHKGCEYWSKNALDKYRKNLNEKTPYFQKHFRHEHVVPKQLIINFLIEKIDAKPAWINKSNVEDLFNRTLKAAVVTKEENNTALNKYRDKMPEDIKLQLVDYTPEDTWARYRDASVQVQKVKWTDRKRNKTIEAEDNFYPFDSKV